MHFVKLNGADTRKKLMPCYPSLDDAETSLCQRVCQHCKVKLKCKFLGYSGGQPTQSKRNVTQSGGVYQPAFLGKLHESISCSSSQRKVVPCDQSGKERVFLEMEMAALLGKNVQVIERR